ncbi:hypothetical protein VTO58DRAFT_109840 [Aureobasidium pullulans]
MSTPGIDDPIAHWVPAEDKTAEVKSEDSRVIVDKPQKLRTLGTTICASVFKLVGQQYTCNKCGTLAHPACHGLKTSTADFVCKTCVSQGKIGDISDLGLGEGEAWVGPVDEDEDGTCEDAEDQPMQQSGRTFAQQRSEELIYDDFSTLLGTQDLNDFASDTQPDDETRHNLVLLSLPVDHVWTDNDPTRGSKQVDQVTVLVIKLPTLMIRTQEDVNTLLRFRVVPYRAYHGRRDPHRPNLKT